MRSQREERQMIETDHTRLNMEKERERVCVRGAFCVILCSKVTLYN